MEKKDLLDMLKHFAIALALAIIIVLAGSSVKSPWLVVIAAPAVAAFGGYLAGRKDPNPKTRKGLIIGWGSLGLAAGILWYLFA